jgi:ElaB/YqjD/DUF883 family membrane-anchored ribosome-binding protein
METKQASSAEHGSGNRVNGTAPAELRDAWDEVSSSVGELYRAADTFASEQTRARPHVALGVAAGIGFVLGGGLASRLGGTLLSVGARLVATRVLEELTSAENRK